MLTRFDRLFFAILPDEPAAERIEAFSHAFRSEHHLARKPLTKDRFHVSLHHAGDYEELPQDIVAIAERAAADVKFPAFEVAFDQIVSVNEQRQFRPIVLNQSRATPKLMLFQKMLEVTLKLTCLSQWAAPWRFKPHLTLFYDDIQVKRNIDTIAWTVREFVLVHSLVGQSQYRLLKRFPLQAA